MIDNNEMYKIEKKLAIGLDVEIYGVTIKNHTIRQLEYDDTLSNFYKNTSISIADVDDYMGRGFKKKNPNIDLIDLSVMFEEIEKKVIAFLNEVSGYEWSLIKTNEFYVFHSYSKNINITKDELFDIIDVFNKMYCMSRYDPYKKYGNYDMADEETKKIIDKIILEEISKFEIPKITMMSMAEGVAYSKFSNLNIFNVWDLTIYQLYVAVKNILAQSEQEIMGGIISNGCADKNFKYNQMATFERK